jgi:hypothetical protein
MQLGNVILCIIGDEFKGGASRRIINKVFYIIKKCTRASIENRRGEEC